MTNFWFSEHNIYGVNEIKFTAARDMLDDDNFRKELVALHRLLAKLQFVEHQEIKTLQFLFDGERLILKMINGGCASWVSLVLQLFYCGDNLKMMGQKQAYLLSKEDMFDIYFELPEYTDDMHACQGQMIVLQDYLNIRKKTARCKEISRALYGYKQMNFADLILEDVHLWMPYNNPGQCRLVSSKCYVEIDTSSIIMPGILMNQLACKVFQLDKTDYTLAEIKTQLDQRVTAALSPTLSHDRLYDIFLKHEKIIKIAYQLQQIQSELDTLAPQLDKDQMLQQLSKKILQSITT